MDKATQISGGAVRCVVVTAAVGLGVLSGCGSESSSTRRGPETPPQASSVKGAIEARYELSFPDDPEWHAFVDVVTLGDERTRETFTVPVDDPVTLYLTVWDGQRVLVAGDEPGDLSYTLYEAPAEEEGLLDSVTGWIVDPESEEFASECPDAQPLEGTQVIAERKAVGYRCQMENGPGEMWIDQETDLLLSQSGIPGEGSDGTLVAEQVTVDAAIDEETFSTDPPAGAEVEVVEATGELPPTSEDEGGESPAALERELREIAASTASSTPIYYLGREFDGEPLSDVVIFDNASGGEAEGDHTLDPGQSLSIMYGDVQIDTAPFRPANYENAAGCSRLPDLRGVPTVQQSDAIWLFTGEFVVRLGNTAEAPAKAARAARGLREADQDEPTNADLPAPPARNMALVDKGCGQNPGDEGPPIED